MGSPVDVSDIEIKIARAEEHLTELNRRVGDWFKEHAVGIFHNHDRQTGWHEIRGQHIPDAPREWGAILGDVGYNLRAARNAKRGPMHAPPN